MRQQFVFAIITLLINANNAQNITCDDNERDLLDLNVQRLSLYGADDRRYPTNNDELKTFCKDNVLINNRIKDYKEKCLDGLAKEIVTLTTSASDRETAAICDSPRKSKEFIGLGLCGNAAKNGTTICWNDLVYNLEGVRVYNGSDFKIPLMCCNYYVFKSCTLDAYDSQPRECKQSRIDELDHMLDKFAIETIETLCGDYVYESDKCDKIIGLTPKPYWKVIRKSPILAIIDILGNN